VGGDRRDRLPACVRVQLIRSTDSIAGLLESEMEAPEIEPA
jgi:hypothetical protein